MARGGWRGGRVRRDEPADGAFAEDLAGVEGEDQFQLEPGIDSPEWKEHMARLFDGDAEKNGVRGGNGSRIRLRGRLIAWR